jgi:hypothetical protein
MSDTRDGSRRRSPTASPAEVAAEAAAFPVTTVDLPIESFFPDWRRRLTRNLATRSDGRWEPLTWVHARVRTIMPTLRTIIPPPRAAMSPTPSHLFAEHRNTRLWSAIQESINELIATREISVNTASDYVVGYLCRELAAKKLIASEESQP